MRKIIMNLAMSLDGFIANEDGSYEWIKGYEDSSLNTDNEYNYETLLEKIDIVVMGKKCYEQDMHLEFKNQTVYVATHSTINDYDNIKFCGKARKRYHAFRRRSISECIFKRKLY